MEKDATPSSQMRHISRSKSYNSWIKVGYELFALEGPEGIQIERLARILDLNKSGFYHYFGNHEAYFQHLMQHHMLQAELLAERIQSARNFAPDCIQYLSSASIPVLVQKQLQRASHISLFSKTLREMNNKIDAVLLPLWVDFIEIPDNPTLALLFLEFVRDIFYARVTPGTLSFDFIFDICMQAKEIGDGLKNTNNSVILAHRTAL